MNEKLVIRRNRSLVSFYLYISPIVILILLFTSYYNSHLDHVIDPYVCRPKSLFTSLNRFCNLGSEVAREDMNNYELGNDRHLTQDQCDAIYPGLYLEADRARDYYKSRGGVKLEDLDTAEKIGNARALIYNNRLYIKSYSEFQQGTRTKAILAAINEAVITSLEPLPDVEFVVQTSDTGTVSGAPWVLGRKAKEESLVLMPDYGFFSWPEPGVNSFLEVQDNTMLFEASLSWNQKIPKLFWRGALMVEIRKELLDIASKYSWGAVSELIWSDKAAVQALLLTPEQHCKYKYLAHVEGFAYSGRLKYLQQCRSVVVAHEMQLPETMANLLDDDERAEKIANNSFSFYRHWLSNASIDCYWRRLIQRWAEVQAFEPKFQGETSFNSFILIGKTHWIPH